MGLEDDVERLRQERQDRENRHGQQERDFTAKLTALTDEFTEVLRRREIPTIPIHEHYVVQVGPPGGRGPERGYHPTPEVLGRGWLFSTYEEYSDGNPSQSPMVLTTNGTLHSQLTVKRRVRNVLGIRFKGYWPSGDFVCVYGECRTYVPHGLTGLKDGMVRFLDRL
ncbi:hypothetical protein ACQPXT_01355 [Streptomyces sp. CA-100214]|uniref:hypothetical protein n=1 Tax=Streptomyces sp. NPDC015408 TaxID=3364956 RepID=UPI0036FB33DF